MTKRNGNWPENALILKTYAELEAYVDAFARGHINLLILVGPPGVAKSRTVRQKLDAESCWLKGNATAFGIYAELFRHRDKCVVLDDLDALCSDINGVRLCKCLAETEEVKTVAWHSSVRTLEKAGIPRQFETRSRLIIISNDWRTLNRNVAALQDRGHVLVFAPTAGEVHGKASEWFRDREILDWFAENLTCVAEPSLRLYVRAAELKKSSLDWRSIIVTTKQNARQRLVAELQSEANCRTAEQRAIEFGRRGGGCRATYFNYLRHFRSAGRT